MKRQKKSKSNPPPRAKLRKKAEMQLRQTTHVPEANISSSGSDAILHDLRVHQIELELKNDELLRVKREVEEERDRYSDLYNEAPVGYVAISELGLIVEANLKACRILEAPPPSLIHQPFMRFIVTADHDAFTRHQRHLGIGGGPQEFEVRMSKQSGGLLWVQMNAVMADVVVWPANREPLAEHLPRSPMIRVTITDITDRKRAEEKIEYQARLLNEVRDAVIATDENRVITFWNNAAEKLYGWSAQEAIGKSTDEEVVGEFTDAQKAEALRILAETGTFRTEVLVRPRNGQPVWVEGDTKALKDEKGKIAGYIAACRDISERKRAEASLKQAEAKYRGVFENSSIGIWQSGLDGHFIVANRAAARMLGYDSPEELMGVNLARFYAQPEDRDELLLRLTKDGAVQGYEMQFTRRDGETLWVSANIRIVRDAEGVPSFIEGLAEDITRRKRVEGALRESEERFNRLSEASFEGIAIHDKGRILDANRALANLFGYELTELIGLSALELAAPESRALVRQNILSGAEKPYEAIGQRKDGTTFAGELIGRPIPYQGRVVRVTAVRDITERKLVEKQTRAHLDELQRWYRVTLEREGRVQDLKREVNELLVGMGQQIRYASQDVASESKL